jgi:hypothetical protein
MTLRCIGMRAFYLTALLLTGIAVPLFSQEAPRPLSEVSGIPTDLYRASNLVTNTTWMSGTVLRNVVVIAFMDGVTAEERSRIYRLVGAHAVYLDPDDGPLPLFYIVEINTHPDACTVQQAITLLEYQPEVKSAYPEMVASFDEDGGLGDVLNTPIGSRSECPSGTGLLH